MKTVTLAQIAEQIRGVSYGKADVVDQPKEGYTPVIRANNITEEGLDLRDLVFVRSEKIGERQNIRSGDILIAASSGSISVVGKSAQVQTGLKAGFGAFCKVVRPSERIDHRYLGHFFRTPAYRQKMSRLAAGANINNLKSEHIDNLKIPFPPLAEQKRIAAILDQADDLRRKRQRALDRLGQLGQAIFYEMFGDPTTNPMGWGMTQLGEIVRVGDRINYGVVQPGDEVESGVPLIRVGDLMKPFIDPSHVKHIDPAIESDYSRSRLIGDEILIGCVGSIGTVALAHPGLKGANIARAVARIPVDTSKVDRIFLAAMIKSPLVQRYFSAETRTVAQPTLNIGLIVRAPILLPPLETQQQFSLTLETLDPICTALGSSLVTIDKLFRSLQHRAFRGEL